MAPMMIALPCSGLSTPGRFARLLWHERIPVSEASGGDGARRSGFPGQNRRFASDRAPGRDRAGAARDGAGSVHESGPGWVELALEGRVIG